MNNHEISHDEMFNIDGGLRMKNEEKDIFSVVSNITLVLLGVSVLLLVHSIYTKADIFIDMVAIFISFYCYIYQRKQIKPR